MIKALLQPKWLIASVVVVALAGLFIYLAFWQLDRREARITENILASSNLAMPVVGIEEALTWDPSAESEYRRVEIDGQWRTSEEVLIRSQVNLGVAGFHVITPYDFGGGAVLVNRGWVPLNMDSTPVDAAPLDGPITGWLRMTQERRWLGPEDPPGVADVLSRVDIDRIQQQVGVPLAPFYLVQEVEDGGQLPVPIDLPEFEDEGPHLAYAIQWFGFTVVGLVGFFFLVRRKAV